MLFKEEFEAGRVKINSSETLKGLADVRFGDDGKVIPSTVSSSVRASALAIAAMRAHREMKQISLLEVQSKYFELLDHFFGHPFAEMKRHGVSPQALASDMADKENIVNAFAGDLQEFAATIKEFWEYYAPVVQAHLEDLPSLKAVFGGDIFPSYTANIACSVGLYTDTVVLPDPLHKLITFAGIMQPRELFRLTTKHALNALCYRELGLADLDVPIVVIAPDYLADNSYRSRLHVAAEADLLEHCSRMFGRSFSEIEELREFLKECPDADELVSRLADPTRMLFDTECSEPLADQFRTYKKESVSQFGLPLGDTAILEHMLLGRMMQINDAVFRGVRYGGTPLIDAPTSWKYLLWKYEYDGKVRGPNDAQQRDLLIAQTMALEGGAHGMLSGMPPEALIELRRNRASVELREIIRRGIAEIDSASDSNLSSVGKQVIENIDQALSEHDRQLRTLSSSRYKFYGFDVSRWIIPVGLSVAASVVHSTPLGFLAAISAAAGTTAPSELWKQFREYSAQSNKLRRSPAGIMFRHLKRNFGFS